MAMAYLPIRPGGGTGRDWRIAVCLGLILLIQAALLHAAVVYKYLDADGNVAYSATPPPIPLRFEIIEIPDAPDTGESASVNYDKIRAMAEQLEKDRKQREQARAAARKEQEQTQAPTPSPEPAVPIYFFPAYSPFYNHRRHPYPKHPSRRPRKPFSRHAPSSSPSPAPPPTK